MSHYAAFKGLSRYGDLSGLVPPSEIARRLGTSKQQVNHWITRDSSFPKTVVWTLRDWVEVQQWHQSRG